MIITLFTILAIIISIIIFYNYTLGFSLTLAAHILIPRVVRVNIGVLDISIHTYLIAILFIVLLLKRIYSEPRIISKSSLWIIIVYVLSIFVFTFVRFNVPVEEQVSSQVQFVVTEIILGVIAFFSINKIEQIRVILVTILISTTIGCVYGLCTYVLSVNPYIEFLSLLYNKEDMVLGFGLLAENRGAIEGRIMGTYTHPLSWGQILLLIFSFFLTSYLMQKKHVKFSLIVFVLLVLANIVFTGSRSSIISSLLFFLFLFLSFKLKDKIKYFTILFSVFFTLVISLPIISKQHKEIFNTAESLIFFWDSKKNSANIGGSTTDLRQTQLERSFELISSNPLFGLGRGYVNYSTSQGNADKIMLGYESVIYYKLVEEGVVGLFLFCLFYFSLYKKTRKALKRGNKRFLFLIDGFYISYFACIILTGIQATFFMFLIFSIILQKQISLSLADNERFE